jgi:hypothetical protein
VFALALSLCTCAEWMTLHLLLDRLDVSVELWCIARGHGCSTVNVIAQVAVMPSGCKSWQNIRGESPCEWQRRRGMLSCLAEALKHNDAVLTLHTSHLLHKCYF